MGLAPHPAGPALNSSRVVVAAKVREGKPRGADWEEARMNVLAGKGVVGVQAHWDHPSAAPNSKLQALWLPQKVWCALLELL